MAKKEAKSEVYDEKIQPKNEKAAFSLILSLFFSFNLFFFGPYDFYISNISSLMLNQNLIFMAIIPVSITVVLIIFPVCFLIKGKAHINICSLIFGLSLALYIQGNYFSIWLGKLDGTKQDVSLIKGIVNLLVWVAIISVPFLIYKFNRAKYKSIIGFMAIAVILIEIITISVSLINAVIRDEGNNLFNRIEKNDGLILSKKNEYLFSKEKNYLIILTDEYDSFCFDEAVKTEPDCVDEFDGFTYFSNTVGMYGMTDKAVPCILTGEASDNTSYIGRDSLFKAINKNYQMNIYATQRMFDEKILQEYSNNLIESEVDVNTVMNVGKLFYKVTFMKYFPEIFRQAFYIYTDEFNYTFSNNQTYYPDNLAFYNTINSNFELTDTPQFKLIYLYGLHDPRYITADLQRAKNWSISGAEQAIAVNKILSKFFRTMKENGVYDNTEIILLADHGLKNHDSGAYPLLMIKRAGDDFEGIQTSYAPISHLDVYPTLMKIAGEDTGKETVYDIDENADRKRFFAQKNIYYNENIKK